MRVGNSEALPNAIWTNWLNSLDVWRAEPSEIFAGIETAARRIWLLSPKSSFFGKSFVIL